MKPLQWKEFFRCVLRTKSRFISMLLIASLGVAFYVGIRASGPDMELSADALYDQTNLMDIRILSPMGLTEDDVAAIRAVDGVTDAQGAYFADALCTIDGKEYVASVFSLCDSINQMTVEQGRLPESASECFADTLFLHATGLSVGDAITLTSGTDDPISDTLSRTEFTIVGSGTYSWYLNWRRGTSSIGDGNVDFFLGLTPDAFSMDVYPVIYAAVDSADSLNSYSDEYEDAVRLVTDRIEAISKERCAVRYESISADAQSEIDDAQKEIDDAQKEIDDGKTELDDARVQLEEAEQEIADGEQELLDSQSELADAEREIADAMRELGEGRRALIQAQIELSGQSELLSEKTQELASGQSELNAQKSTVQAGQSEIAAQKSELEKQQSLLDQQAAELTAQKTGLESQKSTLTAQQAELLAQQAQLNPAIAELKAQRESLVAQRESVSQAIAAYEQRDDLAAQRETLAAQLTEVEIAHAALQALVVPMNQQLNALQPQLDSLNQQKSSLDARQSDLSQRQAALDAEAASIQSAHAALDALSPSSWTTVSGYQAMLDRLSSLGGDLAGQTERSVLEAVRSAVNGALAEDAAVSDELLAAVVPGTAASAISSARDSLSAKESALTQSQTALAEEQSAFSREYAEYQVQRALFDAVYNPLAEGKAALDEQEKEISAGKAALTDGIAQIDAGLVQIDAAIAAIGMTYDELVAAKEALDDGIAQIDANLPAMESGAAQIETGLSQITDGLAQIDGGLTEIAGYESQLADGQKQLTDGLAQIKAGEAQLNQAMQQISSAQQTLNAGRSQLEDGAAELADAQQLLYDKARELEEGEAELSDARRQLNDGRIQIEKGLQELQDGKNELAEKKAEYEQALIDYEEAVAEAEPELEDARRKLADAREDLESLKDSEWYVLDRGSIQTFVEYGMDADRISAIGNVFPVIFFLVAALVCLTGMTRMVEEERIQIGTFKALGYDKTAIAAKYFLYAFIASVIGSLIGISIGSSFLPKVIMGAYGILYSTLTNHLTPLHWGLSLSAVGLAVFSTVFAGMAACMRTLRETPAGLMRPTSPPKGKRVFLEYITPLWRHMSFGQKAAARNLFRYKKRLFMTILGIAGCMALLLVGFGLRDSINKIVDTQYTTVWTYDAGLSIDPDELESVREYITSTEPAVSSLIAVQQTAAEAEGSGYSTEVSLFVPESTDRLDQFVLLHSRTTGEEYVLDDSSVIITEKLASLLGLNPGDVITVCLSETERYDARVQAIAENYLNHYIYLTPACYERIFGDEPEYASLLLTADFTADDERLAFSERMLGLDAVKSVSLVSDLQDSVADMMDAMNLVIWVLIIAAGMLAFIVLFNLNNISILERRRELATLRVLGFYDGELAAYLYRENVVLTLLGIAAGVGLGIILHRFVILTCELDIIMFGRAIQPLSYAASVVMTIFFAALVNFGMFFTLRKIDMVESLKSVE